MPYTSGAEAMVALMAREGVEVVFGLPGVQIMDAVDAIYRDKRIRWISTRHEQTAAYMAYGYARTTDKIGAALTALLKELSSSTASLWQEQEIAAIRGDIKARLEKAASLQLAVIRSIREVLQDDGILVPDITNIGSWCDIAYPVNKRNTYVDSSYFATLGFAFPTALGAKIGNPDRPVVAICGDGGFPYASAELATAVQEGINVVTLVFTDSAYGTVTGIQQRQFGSRFIGNKIHNPRLCQVRRIVRRYRHQAFKPR